MNPPPGTLPLTTPGYAGFALAFSPFVQGRLALASSANYGLVGNGRLHCLQECGPAGISVDKYYDTKDGIYDLAWSELHQNQVATASGDGSVKLWDIAVDEHPVRAWREHSREVMGLDWSNLQKDLFLSCSWDGSLKLWNPTRQTSLLTIPAHSACVYAAPFSPHTPNVVASVSADGTFKQWDLRAPARSPPTLAFQCQQPGGEALSLDWNKYREGVVAVGGTDRGVSIFDLRSVKLGSMAGGGGAGPTMAHPTARLEGHTYAVRRVAWSPHRADVVASAGYDMTCKVWSTDPPRLLANQSAHSEFVVGLAWSLYNAGLLVTCGWDGKVVPWRPLG